MVRTVVVVMLLTLAAVAGFAGPIAAEEPCETACLEERGNEPPVVDNPSFGTDVPPADGQAFATRVRKAFAPGEPTFGDEVPPADGQAFATRVRKAFSLVDE